MGTQLATIADALRSRSSPERILIVGIDGFGGAGKSTLAARLKALLNETTVIAMDDFIVKDHMHDDSWELGWDRHRLIDQVLAPLRRGEPARMQKFDWGSNSLGPLFELPQSSCAIIEGITALHPQLGSYYDYSIWVDTVPALAKQRGEARDAGTENASMWDLWAENDVRYVSEYHPEQRVDAIVSGHG